MTKCILFSIAILTLSVIALFYTPKKRSAFGYKTPMSLKNNDTWNYANNLANKYFISAVLLFIIVEIFLFIFLNDDYKAYRYATNLFIVLSILIIPFVEIALHLKFDKDGKRKN